MNMKTIYHTLRSLACLCCLLTVVGACTEGNDWGTDSSKAALFRVYDVAVTPVARKASVSWTATSTVEYYVIEASTEQLTDNIEQGAGANSVVCGEDQSLTTTPSTITGLSPNTTYYLRVKSYGSGLQSAWAYLDGTFTTTDEDILENTTFTDDDLTSNSIRVAWEAEGIAVTHIVYAWQTGSSSTESASTTTRTTTSEVTTTSATYTLTDTDIANGYATITGLEPGVKYTFYIYNGETLRGMTEATTSQILNTPTMLGGNATVTWASGHTVTRLTYTPTTTDTETEVTTVERTLTSAELNACSASITGLDLGTEYTFNIYNGDDLKGTITATTEQILSISAIGGKYLTVAWTENGTAVDKLTYQAEGGTETEWTAGELAAAETQVTGLSATTTYTIRVYTGTTLRGVATDTTLEDKIDVTYSSLGMSSVTLKWTDEDDIVTSYSIADGTIVSLTDDEILNGTLSLTGLSSNTTYNFWLYNSAGSVISNALSFTTEVNPLDSYTNQVTVTSATEFTNALTDYNGALAIILESGTSISLSGTTIPSNITSLLVWGGDTDGTVLPESSKPEIVPSSWSIQGDKTEVKFYNVYLNSKGYIFRMGYNSETALTGTITDLSFISCRIKASGSGVFAVRNTTSDNISSGTCEAVNFEDCVISDIGNYNLVYVDNSNYSINSITISNTTAYNGTRNIVRSDQSGAISLTIDHCTFYNFNTSGDSSNYWARLSSSNQTISVSNTIFANTFMTPSQTPQQVTSVFYTNDCTGTGTWAEALSYSSTEFFEDAANGDFTITVQDYTSYGDPRWNE